MTLRVLGCSHRNTPVSIRERLAFNPEQARTALCELQKNFADVEAVLLSTCNRTELYVAAETQAVPTSRQLAEFLGQFHKMDPAVVQEHFHEQVDREAVDHLFTVASSLDSMVVGEPQILAQVKQAYQLATDQKTTGPLTHAIFQAATRAARCVASETAIHQRRVSIPSVAVADFARQIFERFDDKKTLVIGAGEMAEETLRYLRDEGVVDVTVINRSRQRAEELAQRWNGNVQDWEKLTKSLGTADLVVSTTGAEEPIVTLDRFKQIESQREQRPLFILDLAVPRDFDAAIGDRLGVYLYSIDDLSVVCERNRNERDKELPKAMRIIEHEADRFMADLHHRATGPIIKRLKQEWQELKDAELERLLNKLPELDDRGKAEISQSFDRLINKLLHPPLVSLKEESRQAVPHGLLDALGRLFHLHG
jgi:glutamyl-tRNA reductase